jgi:hypothetical protein
MQKPETSGQASKPSLVSWLLHQFNALRAGSTPVDLTDSSDNSENQHQPLDYGLSFSESNQSRLDISVPPPSQIDRVFDQRLVNSNSLTNH